MYELMTLNDELAEMILNRVSAPRLAEEGRKTGLRLLREDGWLKVRQGITTVDEVLTCTAL